MNVALAVSKVIVYPGDPRSWTNWSAVHGLALQVDPDFLPRLRDAGVNDSTEAARLLRDRMLDLGYGAVVYRNMHEDDAGSHVGWSWLVLDPDAVVLLPDGFEGAVLPDAVGCAPGLDLPRTARDIPAARNRNGSIRFVSERRSLLEAVGRMAGDMGGEMGAGAYPGYKDHENTYRFTVPFLDGEASCELMPEIGRVSISLPEDHRHAMAGVVDDFVVWVGFSGQPKSSLVYEWQEGEPAEDFAFRLRREFERLQAFAQTPDMAGCSMSA